MEASATAARREYFSRLRSFGLEFDVNRFAVEDLIYSGISPRKELLVEVEEVDHKECSCCKAEDRCDELQCSAYRAFLFILHR